jgi:hypothetical protein
MKTLSALLFVALSSVSTTACVAKLPGMTLPGGKTVGGGEVGGVTTESVAKTIGPMRGVKKELVAYYQKLDLPTLHHLLFDSRRDDIYEKAKTDVGRDVLWQSGNPDPTWIKVWGTKDWSAASGNAETLMQAAFNRRWEAGCTAEYKTSRAAHAKLAKELAAELDAVDGTGNHYARMAGYVTLAAKFEAAAADAGLDARKDPFGPSGFRVTILQHAVAYHQGSRASYQAFPWAQFPLAREVREHGRPLTDDGAFELQAYCGSVSSNGGLGVPTFGSLWGDSHASNRNVAWPTVTGDVKAVAAKTKELVAAAGKTLEHDGDLRIGSIDRVGSVSANEKEPKLAHFSDFVVSAVSRAGDGAKVTLGRKQSDTYSYACKETRKLERIEDDGRLVYQQKCKYGVTNYTQTATVTFAELPPGFAFAKGDKVDFTADVDKDDSKKTKNTPARVEWNRKLVATARVLGTVERGKQKLTF